MYLCNDCGNEFEDPRVIKNGGGDVGEDDYMCPFCGGDDYDAAQHCDLCGKPVKTADMCIRGDGDICVECMERIAADAKALLKENFDEADYSALANYFDLGASII